MNTVRAWLATAALVVAGSTQVGCYAEEEAEPVGPPQVADAEVEAYEGYRPMYYDGYVVYYDSFARPYYYYGGGIRYVPRAYFGYNTLVGHYYAHRGLYPHWYARFGGRYRTFHYVHHRF